MNIIELAKEAGGYVAMLPLGDAWLFSDDEMLKRFADLVRADRKWVDLTDDEIGKAIGTLLPIRRELNDARAVIAVFKEKNK